MNNTKMGRPYRVAIRRGKNHGVMRSVSEDYIVEAMDEAGVSVRQYTDMEEVPDVVAFMPMDVVHLIYIRYHSRHAPAIMEPLQATAFGVGFGRCMGLDGLKDFRYTMRRVNGKLKRGYLGVTGPGSIMVNKKRGRRAKPKPPRIVS